MLQKDTKPVATTSIPTVDECPIFPTRPRPTMQDWVGYMSKTYAESKALGVLLQCLNETPGAVAYESDGTLMLSGRQPRAIESLIRMIDSNPLRSTPKLSSVSW